MSRQCMVMNRRRFLSKSAAILFSSLAGLNSLSKAFAFDKQASQPTVALIIDDIGFNRSRTMIFLDLEIPITFSILPRLAKSASLADKIHAQGHEIMLHQPMEPRNPEIDPGPGALYVGDGCERINEVMEENFSDIPFAIGVNNHMGSKFTASREDVYEALMVIKNKALFFIDSLTTTQSKAYETAKSMNIVAANRNIFLDVIREESAILSQLKKLKSYAIRHGQAIGIGHPFPETAKAIKHSLGSFRESGISLVHISSLMT